LSIKKLRIMHPVCFHVGGFPVHWFGVMMALGFLSGLASWVWLGRTTGRSFNYCSDLLFWIMVSGVLGARGAYVLSDLKHFLAEPLTILRIDQGGLVYYGGLIGGITAIAIFAWLRREIIGSVFDFVVTSVPLAHAFGRIGCFLNGCCFGKPATLWCAVRYPAGSPAWWSQVQMSLLHTSGPESRVPSLPVHPIQLYESLYNLAVYGLLVYLYKRHGTPRTVTAAYLLAYPTGRFFLEFLRGDERFLRAATHLSAAQYTSVLLFLLGCGILLTKGRGNRDGDVGKVN